MRHLEDFPFGKGPLVMVFLLLVSSIAMLTRGSESGVKLDFWVFAQTHYNEYKARVPVFEKHHPEVKVLLRLVDYDALRDRLLTAFLSDFGAPDLVEVEISSVGRFFKGPLDEIGFVDLKPRLEAEGWMEKLVVSRFTPWSNRGHIFGLPHDLHPVVLLYRDDIFKQSGVDLHTIETWEEFVEAGKKATKDRDGDGKIDQYAMVLANEDWMYFWGMLLQRGGGMFDADGNVIIDSPLAVDTLKFYVDMLKTHQIAVPNFGVGPVDPANYAAMKEGVILSVMAPDWYVGILKTFAPELEGKWKAMPLPAWEKGGRRTATLGGTMIGMTKQCKNKDLAWEFMKFAYFDRQALVNRYETTLIIPPLKAAWNDPVFAQPDPYLGGQALGLLFTSLAEQIPPVYINAYWAEATDAFDDAIFAAVKGEKTPERALKDLADLVRKAMREDRISVSAKFEVRNAK